MSLNRHTGFALLLIIFGGLILLNKVGIHTGYLMGFMMSWIVPIAMVALGYIGIKNGSKIAWVIAILGLLILLGKMSGLFVILIAVVLIGCGVSLLKKSPNV
jgi:hypothetical protein